MIGNGVWGAANPSAAWINRGVALRRLGRYQEALESYDSAIALRANDPLIWNNKGTMVLPQLTNLKTFFISFPISSAPSERIKW
ncbi:MAG: tetratricopeptide repeat protein [Spirulinaceae cyanobacterium]